MTLSISGNGETLTAGPDRSAGKPSLVFFYSSVSGWARRMDGFLASVLQRRRNHDTFRLYRVAVEDHPELAARFAVATLPTLVVIEAKEVRARLENPRGAREIEAFLAPWLRAGRANGGGAQDAGHTADGGRGPREDAEPVPAHAMPAPSPAS